MQLFIEVNSIMPDVKRLPNYVPIISKKAMDRSGKQMVRIIKNRIKASVPPRLKRATINRKKALRYSRPTNTLWAKGILYRAIHCYRRRQPGLTDGIAVGVKQIGKPDRRFLAIIHNDGMGNMPARRFFYISRKNFDEIIRWTWKAWFDEYRTFLNSRRKKEKLT